MSKKSLGTLTIDLVANVGGFTEGLSKAERESAKHIDKIKKNFTDLSSKLAPIFATIAAGAATAMGAALVSTANYANELNDMAAKLQMPVKELDKLFFISEQVGLSTESMAKSQLMLKKSMAEALDPTSKTAEMFKALGVNIKDSAGNVRQTEDVFFELIDVIGTLEGEELQMAAVTEIFKKSGMDLIPILGQTKEQLDELSQSYDDIGGITEDTAFESGRFYDNLDSLKLLIKSVSSQILSEFLPVVNKIIEDFLQWSKETGGVKTISEDLIYVINLVGSAASGMGSIINGVIDILVGLYTAAIKAVSALASLGGTMRDLLSGKISFDNVLQNVQVGWAETAINFTAGAENIKDGIKTFGKGVNGEMSSAVSEAKKLSEQLKKEAQSQAALRKINKIATMNVDNLLRNDGKDEDKPARPSRSGGGGRSRAQKISEEEREQQRLNETYSSMVDTLNREIALIGERSDLKELEYDLEFGKLAKLDEEKKNFLLNLTKEKELRKQAYEEQKAAEEEAARLKEDQLRRQQSQQERFDEMLASYEYEIELLGKTQDEQEIINALKEFETDLTGRDIELLKEKIMLYQQERKEMEQQVNLADEIRGSMSNALFDFASGAKSFKDSMMGALESIHNRILQMISDNLMEKLFGGFGGQMGGSAGGGFLSNIIGGLFGGGLATGGYASPGMFYEVNEKGPELISFGNKDFLMMGNKSANITPNHKLSGGSQGFQQVNNFNIQGRIDRRTETQIAIASGSRAQVSNRRVN